MSNTTFTPLHEEVGLDPVHEHDFEGQAFVCMIRDDRAIYDPILVPAKNAARGRLLLDAYAQLVGDTGEGLLTVLADLLGDLMHHVHRETGNVDLVDEARNRAIRYFFDEVREACLAAVPAESDGTVSVVPVAEVGELGEPETTFFRTLVTVEVLSSYEPWVSSSVEDLAHQITSGDCSGLVSVADPTRLTRAEMAAALKAQGSSPDFLITDWGDLDEDKA